MARRNLVRSIRTKNGHTAVIAVLLRLNSYNGSATIVESRLIGIKLWWLDLKIMTQTNNVNLESCVGGLDVDEGDNVIPP